MPPPCPIIEALRARFQSYYPLYFLLPPFPAGISANHDIRTMKQKTYHYLQFQAEGSDVVTSAVSEVYCLVKEDVVLPDKP